MLSNQTPNALDSGPGEKHECCRLVAVCSLSSENGFFWRCQRRSLCLIAFVIMRYFSGQRPDYCGSWLSLEVKTGKEKGHKVPWWHHRTYCTWVFRHQSFSEVPIGDGFRPLFAEVPVTNAMCIKDFCTNKSWSWSQEQPAILTAFANISIQQVVLAFTVISNLKASMKWNLISLIVWWIIPTNCDVQYRRKLAENKAHLATDDPTEVSGPWS